MLLRERPLIQGRDHALAVRSEPTGTRTVRRRVVAQPSVSTVPRAYPPITWSTPSLGQAFASGLSGILRGILLLTLFATALLSSAMAIAVVIAHIITALGFHPWTAY